MLKVLNVLGYFSLLSLFYYIANFILSFDLFLQIINLIFVILSVIINFVFFKKKKYLGIRCFIIITILFILSILSYNIYSIARGNLFKNSIYEIYDQNKNIIITSENLSSYNGKFIPDKLMIDMISKGNGQKGYIKFKESNNYEDSKF